MAKKILQNRPELEARPEYPDEVGTLGYIGKVSINYFDHYAEEDVPGFVLYIDSKNKRVSRSKKSENADLATFCLEELGFEDVDNLQESGASIEGLALANIELEYDLNAKPYKITNAKAQEMKSLQYLMQYAGAKVKVARKLVDAKGKEVIKKVPAAEFKQAVANYIAQNQK